MRRMATITSTNFVNNLRAGPRPKNTDGGISTRKPPIQNVHISLTVCSMEQRNKRP